MPTQHPASAQQNKEKQHRWLRQTLTVLCLVLLVVVLLAPGVLELLYRADARTALRNARFVRMALDVTSTGQYGGSAPFADAAKQGGVAEGVYEDVLFLSKAPGEFWILQTDESGYRVQKFIYQENEYTVWYDRSTHVYTVYHDRLMIGDEDTDP